MASQGTSAGFAPSPPSAVSPSLPSHTMPPTPLESAAQEPVAIFAYGTLRADSGSTSTYTTSFNEGCVSVPATLHGAQMYFDSSYPFVVLAGGERGRPGDAAVRGLLVFPPDLGAKVREADRIEQEGTLYKRYGRPPCVCGRGGPSTCVRVGFRVQCGGARVPGRGPGGRRDGVRVCS